MRESIEQIREQLGAGTVTAQSLVLLFGVVSEAEERRDVPELEEALALARRIARTVEEALVPEAERLVALCEASVERVRDRAGESAAAPAEPGQPGECPGCGRAVAADAVRCRACGVLLV